MQRLITALSCPAISRELDISENTVKSHITNFYNKLGINNKIELMNAINHIETGQNGE
jgi:DNA-binding NarL/FixJ family response regulator